MIKTSQDGRVTPDGKKERERAGRGSGVSKCPPFCDTLLPALPSQLSAYAKGPLGIRGVRSSLDSKAELYSAKLDCSRHFLIIAELQCLPSIGARKLNSEISSVIWTTNLIY